MNQIEKAEEYANKCAKDQGLSEMGKAIAQEAFIAGSKSGYSAGVKSGIEIARNNDEPQQFSADEFAPEMPDGHNVNSHYAVCVDTEMPVFYDYEQNIWLDERAKPVAVKRWRYPKAIRLEKEKTLPDIIEAIEERRNDMYQVEYELPKDSYFNLLDNIIKELKKINNETSK